MRLATRLGAVATAVAFAGAFGACSRLPRPRRQPAPARRDTTVAVVPPRDTARRDTAARALPSDSARRDSARLAAADSAKTPARPRRRDAGDPTSRCRAVDFSDSPLTSRLQSYKDANNQTVLYVGGGVVAKCQGIKNRLQADSAEYYEVNGQMLLVNNVVYDETGRVHLTTNRLTYNTSTEQLLAEGNVVITLPSGTTMTGPQAEYLREAPPIRERARMTAIGRPTLRVITTAEQARPAGRDTSRARRTAATATSRRDTATIIANTIVDEGDSLVYAGGQVQILRPDVNATSDSATFDQGTELAHLINNAQIRGQRGRPFTLSGSLVDLYSKQRELTRVVSRGKAHVVSDDLDLKSDTVDLRVRESKVERAYAWGPSRATAVSPDRDVVADSIEAILPEQRITELHAVRRAVARSVPDSTKIASKERDFLAGDTIVARFDSAAAARDTTKNPPVRQIVAAGNASSYYQVATSEGRASPPGINYVKGRIITVAFDSGQMRTVTVTDSATGVYLEPGADSASDSTPARRGRNASPATRRGGAQTPVVRRPGGRPDDESQALESAVAPAAVISPRRGTRTARRGAR